MDLQQELEDAIGRGPALPLPEERLAAGQRALRRRRLVVGAAAATAAAAIVLPVAVVTAGLPSTGREAPPAAPSPSSRVELFDRGQSAPVDVDQTTRRLEVEEDVVVRERIDDVVPGIVGWSAALDLSQGDRRYWVVLAWDETRADVLYDEVEPGAAGLATWAETRVRRLERTYAPGRAPSERVPGLSWQGDRFVGGRAVEVLQQRSPVDLGERFAPPGSTTAAALVDVGGLRTLVLWRQLPGVEGQLLTRDDVGDRDLDAALAVVSETYAAGAE